MNRKISIISLILPLLISVVFVRTAKAQMAYGPYDRWFVSANVGWSAFYGDVTDGMNQLFSAGPFQSSYFENRGFGLNVAFGKHINRSFSLRANCLWDNVQGRDNTQHFKTSIQEYSAIGMLDFLDLFNTKYEKWDLYAMVGFGVTLFETKLYNNSTDALVSTPEELALTIPVGLGVNYHITPDFCINFEMTLRPYLNDNVDGRVASDAGLEGQSFTSIGINYTFDFNKGSKSVKSRNASARFYKKNRMNGDILVDPFDNRSNSRSTVKHKMYKTRRSKVSRRR